MVARVRLSLRKAALEVRRSHKLHGRSGQPQSLGMIAATRVVAQDCRDSRWTLASCQKRNTCPGDEMELGHGTGAPGSPERTWAENHRSNAFTRRTQLSQSKDKCRASPVFFNPGTLGRTGAPVWFSHPPVPIGSVRTRLRQTFLQLVKRATTGSAGFLCGPAVCARARRWRDKRHW